VKGPPLLNVYLNVYSPSSQSSDVLTAVQVYPFEDRTVPELAQPDVQTHGKSVMSTYLPIIDGVHPIP
jgi:hypothetical protein